MIQLGMSKPIEPTTEKLIQLIDRHPIQIVAGTLVLSSLVGYIVQPIPTVETALKFGLLSSTILSSIFAVKDLILAFSQKIHLLLEPNANIDRTKYDKRLLHAFATTIWPLIAIKIDFMLRK